MNISASFRFFLNYSTENVFNSQLKVYKLQRFVKACLWHICTFISNKKRKINSTKTLSEKLANEHQKTIVLFPLVALGGKVNINEHNILHPCGCCHINIFRIIFQIENLAQQCLLFSVKASSQ